MENMDVNKKKIKLKIWIQFSLTILFAVMALIQIFLNKFNEALIYFFLLQIISTLSANVCSVSCTMMYYDKNSNDEMFILKKVFYILGSVAIYMIIFFLNISSEDIIWYRVWNISLIVLFSVVVIVILYFVIKELWNVYVKDSLQNQIDDANGMSSDNLDGDQIKV